MIKKICSYSCIILGLLLILNTFHGVIPGELLNTALKNIFSLILDISIFEIGMRL
jgi:hypothetical protein